MVAEEVVSAARNGPKASDKFAGAAAAMIAGMAATMGDQEVLQSMVRVLSKQLEQVRSFWHLCGPFDLHSLHFSPDADSSDSRCIGGFPDASVRRHGTGVAGTS